MKSWQLQEAKSRFSEVVERALKEGPQEVTRRGLPTVMVISIEDYEKARQSKPRPKRSLVQYLRDCPCPELSDLLLEDRNDTGRDIQL